MHINPDHFLQTPAGRVTTPERNRQAWQQSYQALAAALQSALPDTRVYLLVGPQGAGKSTWARANAPALPNAVFFDAILVKRSERAAVLEIVRRYDAGAIAVWFKTPLEVCLARNTARPVDEVVDERALRNVHAAVEPPSVEEGFERIIEVVAEA